jgi:hypothetical protein
MKMERADIQAQFILTAATAKDEKAIGQALLSLPTNCIDQKTADTVTRLCRAKGLDPQHRDILTVYEMTSEYKAEQARQERQKALSRSVTDIEAFIKNYRENEAQGKTPTAEQLDTETAALGKTIAGLGAVETQRRIYTLADYKTDCLNYDPDKDFSPDLFGGLAFPDGTTSYIGARTSRGKTTIMTNIARETLASTQRKVIFITLEMSGKQIINKLILSTIFAMGADTNEAACEALQSIQSPGKELYHVWKNEAIAGTNREGPELFRQFSNASFSKIETVQQAGRFILFDGRGSKEKEIIDYITTEGEAGAVILLDYIQKMPPKEGTDTDSFRRVQAISYDVVNAAAKTNSIIIAGAQFNRLGGTDGLGDVFTDESFRECGDLEQDAHNAIGIGWKIDKQGRFYEVLKTREDKQQGSIFDIVFSGGYSYMARGNELHRTDSGKTAKTGGKKTTTTLPQNVYEGWSK